MSCIVCFGVKVIPILLNEFFNSLEEFKIGTGLKSQWSLRACKLLICFFEGYNNIQIYYFQVILLNLINSSSEFSISS